MSDIDPRDHHYVPQFYLREFACNPEQTKVKTIARSGDYAVFKERSIKTLGWERDFYVHERRGVPVNVETLINRAVETPLSSSDAWRKISLGLSHQLDRTDKGVIYALIRHLEARGPRTRQLSMKLAALAADPNCTIPFTDEEREMYAEFRRNPAEHQCFMNFRAVSAPWSEREFHGSMMTVYRSSISLRSSSVPVISMSVPHHPALHLPLPGQVPFMYAMSLNRTTLATLVFGDFDGAFFNVEMPVDAAIGFNRHYAADFANFNHVRHLIADDEHLIADMTWAPYDLLESKRNYLKFKRRRDT